MLDFIKSKVFLSVITGIFITAAIGASFYFIQKKDPSMALSQADEIETISSSTGNGVLPDYQYAAPWDKKMYDGYYAVAKAVPEIGTVKGGIVPHHLVAGYIPAAFFNYLKKQQPSVVVLFGPNHFNRGGLNAISTLRDWKSPYGITKTDTSAISALLRKGLVAIDEGVMKEEHSVYSIIPFIKSSLPETKVVPIIFKFNTPTSTVDGILTELKSILPSDAVFVGSIDFSHYQTLASANFHDELSEGAIKNFDYERSQKLEIDSPPSLYAVMKSMENAGSQKIAFALHDNSADILKQPDLKETTSHYSPYFVSGAPEQEKISSLLFFGDMMLDRNVKKAIDKNGQDYLFSVLAGQEGRFFMGMDAVHANLEGPFANSRRETTKSIAFRFDPVLLPMLKKYNFSIFSAANNHTLDMSSAGFKESNANLTKAGFDVYGNQYSVDDNSMLIKKVGDYNIAFIGLNDTNSPLDENKVIELIKKGKSAADFVIMNIHWGEEYKEISNARQRQLAHTFIDSGADAIVGHHAHVVEEMEVYKNRPIFYSLGNFIFDQYFSVPTQQGLAIGLVLKDKTESIYVFPMQGSASQVSQMDYAQAVPYMNSWISKSRLDNYTLGFDNFNLNISR
jgi:AmmeMemoRadiSam system protein B